MFYSIVSNKSKTVTSLKWFTFILGTNVCLMRLVKVQLAAYIAANNYRIRYGKNSEDHWTKPTNRSELKRKQRGRKSGKEAETI